MGLVSRLTQRSFVYLVAVYVLDPNLRPLAPPFIRFENGVAEIVGKYFGDVFFAPNFDFPRHMMPNVRCLKLRLCMRHATEARALDRDAVRAPHQFTDCLALIVSEIE